MVDVLHSTGLGDLLREHRRSWPQQTAVVDGAVRLTYPELDDRVNRIVAALAGAGVSPGDRVLWLGQNSFRIVELLFAAAKLGAILCPANWRQTADEMAFVLDDLDPKVVVWQDAEIGETVQRARRAFGPGRARWIQHDGDGEESYEGFVAAVGHATDPDRAIDPASAVLCLYTAAFEGRPNGALLSHTALIGQGLIIGRLSEIDSTSVYLNCGPMFHVATLFSTLATLVHAGTNVFTPRVEAEELCRLIESERCTGAFLVGPTFRQIRELNRDRRYDISSLRAAAGRDEWNAMITVDTSPWVRHPGGYGQTEVVGMLSFAAFGAGALGGHGRTSPLLQVRIVDPDDREVEPGETGEITCRGPLVMNGYWNRPEETERRFRNGWHHTNDLGRREVDGSLTFVGPKTRIIKSAAENIYPAEVEGALRTHPDVADCAVIGVPDKQWTQSVVGVVVARDGSAIDGDAVIAHVRERIASYKKPRRIEVVDAIPRNGFAVDYDALDARFGGGGYPGVG
ncbi:MAG TPA: AMP-binding protein [Acidimicrobiia bacterium]|nr:AMP-binding protein [Acidimicrobiia bacterium]